MQCRSKSHDACLMEQLDSCVPDLSNMVDVFTVLPGAGRTEQGHVNGDGTRSGHIQKTDATNTDTKGYKPSPVSLKQLKIEDVKPIPMSLEHAYRSVKSVGTTRLKRPDASEIF